MKKSNVTEWSTGVYIWMVILLLFIGVSFSAANKYINNIRDEQEKNVVLAQFWMNLLAILVPLFIFFHSTGRVLSIQEAKRDKYKRQKQSLWLLMTAALLLLLILIYYLFGKPV